MSGDRGHNNGEIGAPQDIVPPSTPPRTHPSLHVPILPDTEATPPPLSLSPIVWVASQRKISSSSSSKNNTYDSIYSPPPTTKRPSPPVSPGIANWNLARDRYRGIRTPEGRESDREATEKEREGEATSNGGVSPMRYLRTPSPPINPRRLKSPHASPPFRRGPSRVLFSSPTMTIDADADLLANSPAVRTSTARCRFLTEALRCAQEDIEYERKKREVLSRTTSLMLRHFRSVKSRARTTEEQMEAAKQLDHERRSSEASAARKRAALEQELVDLKSEYMLQESRANALRDATRRASYEESRYACEVKRCEEVQTARLEGLEKALRSARESALEARLEIKNANDNEAACKIRCEAKSERHNAEHHRAIVERDRREERALHDALRRYERARSEQRARHEQAIQECELLREKAREAKRSHAEEMRNIAEKQDGRRAALEKSLRILDARARREETLRESLEVHVAEARQDAAKTRNDFAKHDRREAATRKQRTAAISTRRIFKAKNAACSLASTLFRVRVWHALACIATLAILAILPVAALYFLEPPSALPH